MSKPAEQWVYLVRFFVGLTGEVACYIRDIGGTESWFVVDAERAQAAFDALESTRPSPHPAKRPGPLGPS